MEKLGICYTQLLVQIAHFTSALFDATLILLQVAGAGPQHADQQRRSFGSHEGSRNDGQGLRDNVRCAAGQCLAFRKNTVVRQPAQPLAHQNGAVQHSHECSVAEGGSAARKDGRHDDWKRIERIEGIFHTAREVNYEGQADDIGERLDRDDALPQCRRNAGGRDPAEIDVDREIERSKRDERHQQGDECDARGRAGDDQRQHRGRSQHDDARCG